MDELSHLALSHLLWFGSSPKPSVNMCLSYDETSVFAFRRQVDWRRGIVGSVHVGVVYAYRPGTILFLKLSIVISDGFFVAVTSCRRPSRCLLTSCTRRSGPLVTRRLGWGEVEVLYTGCMRTPHVNEQATRLAGLVDSW